MTRKPNFAKFILGTCVLALVFVGTWAATSTRLASAKKSAALPTTTASAVSTAALNLSAPLIPVPVAVDDDFELDGNIKQDGTKDDWGNVNCPLAASDGGSSVAHTGVVVDGISQTVFTGGGSKDDHPIGDWKWKNGPAPNKDEILNSYAAKYAPNTLVFGAERIAVQGSAFIGVWFFQQDVEPIGTPTAGFSGAHQAGDVLILNEFDSGGASTAAKVFKWITNANQCTALGESLEGTNLCNITNTAPPGSTFSTTNSVALTAASQGFCWTYTNSSGGTTMPAQAFFEGGINLDAFPALAGACFSSFLIETRSSFETSSQLKDFAGGRFNTCPAPEITKTADSPICDGTDAVYTYTVTNPAGSDSVSVTLSDDNAGGTAFDPAGPAGGTCIETTNGGTGAGPGSPITVAGGATRTFECTRTLTVGEHTNTVTMTWNSGGPKNATASATVTVLENPDARISVLVCPDGSTFLTGSDANNSGGTFAWSGAGSGTSTTTAITGVGNYTLTISNGTCTDSATRTIGLCSDSDDAP
ncbi:MAG TPA: hypothetical protein VMZ30_22650 [Pyrinomonadaceae bacterium]|nr:hypothetical protein [Pyrinomonadaceae bacterium]